jgi:hypothetical protein
MTQKANKLLAAALAIQGIKVDVNATKNMSFGFNLV